MACSIQKSFYIAVLLLLTPISAWAFQLQLGLSTQSYDYQESHSARELNRETGLLPLVSLLAQAPLTGKWQWNADITYGQGSVDYNGETQAGKAFLSTTDIKHIRWHTGLGYCFYDCFTQLGFGLGQYQLDRSIRGKGQIKGLDEQFRWHEWTLSLSQALSKNTPEQWRLSTQLFQTHKAKIGVDLRPAGFSKVLLALPDGLGYRIHLEHQWQNLAMQALTIRLGYEYRDMKQSDSMSIGNSSSIFLPANKSRHWQLGLLISF